MSSYAHDVQAVIGTLNRYADACDRRDWSLFDEVFTEDAVGDYGPGFVQHGRTAIVASIRSFLGGCGPTQHLLGNYDVELADGADTATASCKVRAFHLGRGDKASLSYEAIGSYHDELRRTPQGWRIAHRRMVTSINLGTMDVLGPD